MTDIPVAQGPKEVIVKSTFSISIMATVTLLTASALGQPFTPTIVPTVAEPIGVAADTSRVLVTTPYCDGLGVPPRGIYNVVSGVPSLLALLPLPSYWGSSCFEMYPVISNGIAGFPAGNTYVTVGNLIKQVSPGGVVTTFATLPFSRTNNPEISITLDRVGTWGNKLIAVGNGCTDGTTTCGASVPMVFLIDSSGGVTSFTVPASGAGNVQLESAEVAPLTWGIYGGFLIVGREADLPNGKSYAISPLDHSLNQLPANYPQPRPENEKFFPPQACSLNVPGVGTTTFIQAIFAAIGPGGQSNKLAYYNGIVSPAHLLVNLEDDLDPLGGRILMLDSTGNIESTLYGRVPVNSSTEGNSIILCPLTKGCTLTQGGYKNNFNSKVLNFPLGGLTLGTNFYNNSQLNAILQNNAVKGNGLISLAHQLITAQLNIYYGALPTPAVAQAIVQANNLIGNRIIPPLGSGFLAPGTTAGIETILDNFNNSSECK